MLSTQGKPPSWSSSLTYDPDVNTLKRGQPVVLVIHGIDVTHGLRVDEWNIKSDEIRKGKDTEIQFYSRRSGSL